MYHINVAAGKLLEELLLLIRLPTAPPASKSPDDLVPAIGLSLFVHNCSHYGLRKDRSLRLWPCSKYVHKRIIVLHTDKRMYASVNVLGQIRRRLLAHSLCYSY
jgi:hypothetical protein